MKDRETYYVYAIKSLAAERIYVGMSEDPEKRLFGHNKGETKSTKSFRPWKFIYTKLVGNRSEARLEEKKLKSGYGREFLRNLDV